jgi:four helix bundle protein
MRDEPEQANQAGNRKDAGNRQDLKGRTKVFALRIIRLYANLPKTTVAQVLGKQFLRSGTSAGAHYFEAQRAKSTADFINKIEGALQELEETGYWLSLLADAKIIPSEQIMQLSAEVEELISVFVAITKSAKHH